jgi:hypothetical protein
VGDAPRRQMVGLRPHETDRTDPAELVPHFKDGCSRRSERRRRGICVEGTFCPLVPSRRYEAECSERLHCS